MTYKNLSDPQNLANDIDKLNEKLSIARTKLAMRPDKGGMPFIYSFAATKDHVLDKIELPGADGEKVSMETAATNGKQYKWHPDFLRKLTDREIMIVIAHETYHIILQHCNPTRTFGKNPMVWNLAVDYVVNGIIEHDIRHHRRVDSYACDRAYKEKTPHPLWGGNFGRPITLKELLKTIDTQGKQLKKAKKVKKNSSNETVEDDNNKKEEPERVVYADFSLYERSAESIYDEIMKKLRENGMGNDLDDILKAAGFDTEGMDHHEKIDISRTKLLEEVMNAATTARKMCGNIPSAIEDQLKQLENPKLKWQDLVRHAMQKIRQEKGRFNDWSRFRRRALSLNLYMPKKKDDSVRWLCMLDTSGSMSDEDIVYGVSQLKVLDGRSKGIVVPCDAKPYWDKAIEIHTMSDLPKVKVVGRGGTVFDEFFRDYQKHIKEPIDLIIVITDGYVFLDPQLKPPVDVVFVITNSDMPKLPWGRVAPLRG